MNLYIANGRYVGTQAEARKLDRDFRPVTVPTDKPGLIDYLNALRSAAGIAAAVSRLAPPAPPPVEERPERDMSASAVLSRADNAGIDVDGIVETIGRADGYALRRYAGAVAIAFQRLEACPERSRGGERA